MEYNHRQNNYSQYRVDKKGKTTTTMQANILKETKRKLTGTILWRCTNVGQCIKRTG